MSGCGCKSGVNSTNEKKMDVNKITPKNYVIKIILFTVLVLISPAFLGIIIWFLFKTLILDKELEILPLLLKLSGKNIINDTRDEDDDEDDEEDDVIPINVENITNKYK